MQSPNRIVIAAAGGGKTTRIVTDALQISKRVAMVTFTNNNTDEISKKIYELNGHVPSRIEVRSWFSFLIREMARPYQRALYERRIDGMNWIPGRSDRFAKSSDIARFYFGNGPLIYSDKVAQFVCACNTASDGAVIRRLEQRFSQIYVDEIQDMSGYDLDLLELLLKSKIEMILVGDHRQSTYVTNNAAKNRAYQGLGIINKFREWEKRGLCSVGYEVETYRSNQSIADLADAFFPDEPTTLSRNTNVTGHDGVFAIPISLVANYVQRHRPQVLRLSRTTDCLGYGAMNFGESKGLTFDRVLIFPHQKGKQWLKTGDFKHIEGSVTKLYVGVTRARYSVAFVIDDDVQVGGITRFTGPLD